MMRTMALTDDAILEAADVLRAGGTVVYPTETAYALGADPTNIEAVKKVFALKGRDDKKPMGLIAASLEQVDEWCVVSAEERRLMTEYWPGPLSIVLALKPLAEADRDGFQLTSAGKAAVSVRVSGNMHARQLAEAFGRPVIATSANRNGRPSVFSMSLLMQEFADSPQPDLVLDGGNLVDGPMSTVVQVLDGRVIVHREGAVKVS